MVAAEARELREARWRAVLATELAALGLDRAAAAAAPKGAAWKVRLARRLREEAGAPHAWISGMLQMGSVGALRVAVSRLGEEG